MLVHAYNGVDLTSVVALANQRQGFATSAKLGQAESIGIVVDDRDGTLSFTGHKAWTIRETTAPAGNQVIWVGFVGPKAVSRKSDVIYPNAAGRVWDITLVEASTILVRRILRPEATLTKRPQETVSDRVAWILTTPGLAGVVVDGGLVAASSVVMDAHDYGTGGQNAATVLEQCAGECGFNYAIRYREATDDFQLIFQPFRTSTLDQSTLRISNDPADVDSVTTFAPNDDAKIRQIPDNIAYGVELSYGDGATVYRTDPATGAAFAEIDQSAPSSWVKSAATATTLADHFLEQHSTEEEKVDELEIEVPAASVNLVKEGQLIEAKFTHGPGWESFRPARVMRKVVKVPENLDQERFRLGLEIQPAEPLELVSTQAQLMGPSKDGGSDWGYAGSGMYQPVHHKYTGDNPFPGGTVYALSGLIEYMDGPGDRTGLRVLGAGTVTVVLAFSCSKVTNGGITFTARINRNGGTEATFVQTLPNIGLTTYGWEPIHGTALVASFDVVAGDEITWSLHNSKNEVLSALPTGVGNADHIFRITGLLAA